jgi:hypothetical protein
VYTHKQRKKMLLRNLCYVEKECDSKEFKLNVNLYLYGVLSSLLAAYIQQKEKTKAGASLAAVGPHERSHAHHATHSA